ncbi:MAG TPA: MurR/RpiR family transcriptional regulator [Acidimicrobiales bacterium]
MTIASVIDAARGALTPAERRLADVVLTTPECVAFGTVADLATRASTSGATVVRFASKLGYDGFTALQGAVQDELGQRLRPAAERIREVPPTDVLGRVRAVELDNVAGTLEAASPAAFDEVAAALADLGHQVHVLSGEASRGIGLLLHDQLAMLRPGVSVWFGADVRLARHVANVQWGDVLIAIDHRRYERWIVDTTRLARDRGARVVALCDGALSPLADLAWSTFVVRAQGAGPFDSHVGTLALANALVSAAAAGLQRSATERLDGIEAAWREFGSLIGE